MARRSKETLSVQLFPFLAVLVCVMGSLIFLLLVTSKKMREQAIARAMADLPVANIAGPRIKPAAPIIVDPAAPSDLAARRAALAAQLEELQAAHARQLTALQQQKLLATAAQRRMQNLKDEIAAEERKLGAVAGQMAAARLAAPDADAERQKLEQQILRMRRQLKQLEEQQRKDEGKFTLIPFDGKSGTTRRPIFVECTDSGFRFVAEDVLIRPSDIQGFSDQYNPLLAGAAALSAYWNQQNGGDPNNEPYVLLIVRPNGTLAYYISQRLLARLKTPFGYELVPDDMELSVPPAEPGAKAACAAAVQKLLAEREQQTAEFSGPGGLGRGPGFGGGLNGSGSGSGVENTKPGSGFGGPTGGSPGTGTGGAAGTGNPSAPRGGVVGVPGGPGRAGGSRQKSSFDMADLNQEDGVGDRSWENIERFEGREYRNGSAGQKSSAQASKNGGSKPGTGTDGKDDDGTGSQTAKSGEDAGDEDGTGTKRTGPFSSDTGSQTGSPNGKRSSGVTTADYNERQHPSFARQRKQGDQRTGSLPYEQLQRRKWGQHSQNATIGLEHEVTIRVDATRMVVDDNIAIPVPNGIGRNELFDRLLSVVDHQANTWGRAPSGFFWIPSLKFIISPGGNQVYNRMSPLLTKSGLASFAEFTLDEAEPAKK